jgi:hypothetical protein
MDSGNRATVPYGIDKSRQARTQAAAGDAAAHQARLPWEGLPLAWAVRGATAAGFG